MSGLPRKRTQIQVECLPRFADIASETKRILGLAFEMTCTALRIGDCDDGVKQAIADKIIDLAKGGGRNPDVLCEQALKDIRGPEV